MNVRAAVWAMLVEQHARVWDIPEDPFTLSAWANPYVQVNYDIPPIPDEPPELRTRYTPDDALPTDLLRYRTDNRHGVTV